MFTQQNNVLVNEVMLKLDKTPTVAEKEILKIAMEEMGRAHLGMVCIIDSEKKLLGVLTDGDIRRKLLQVQKPFSAFLVDDALDHAIISPATIEPNDTLAYAVEIMGRKQIWDLPVVTQDGLLVGLLHLHPAVKSLLGLMNK